MFHHDIPRHVRPINFEDNKINSIFSLFRIGKYGFYKGIFNNILINNQFLVNKGDCQKEFNFHT